MKNVEVITGPFESTLTGALESVKAADLIFIDGDHREGPTRDYFMQCLPYTHQDTVIIIDDIHYSPGMQRAWEAISNSSEVIVSIDLFHQGWVWMKKELSPQQFVLRYP